MHSSSQQIYLIRHGETEWSKSGQHTGRTDIPLTANGRVQAEAAGRMLSGHAFSVWCSPLLRARETCHIAGLSANAIYDDDLMEWNYGIYDGRTADQIRETEPGWSVWESPIPDGESLDQVAQRARSIIRRATAEVTEGDIAFVAHGHILRILAACWIGDPPITARNLALETAAICILGYDRQVPVIQSWNIIPPR